MPASRAPSCAVALAAALLATSMIAPPGSTRSGSSLERIADLTARADRRADADIIGGRYIVILDQAPAPVRGKRAQGAGLARVNSARRVVAASVGARPVHRYASALSGFSARLDTSQVRRLRRDPRVAAVVPDRLVRASGITETSGATPGAARAPSVTDAQAIPTGIRRIGAWRTGSSVDADIAIVDSGIGSAADQTMAGELDVVGGVDCTGQDDTSDHNGHGTHVAGIAAAVDNDMGVVGVAPGARLWSVRVLDADGSGNESDVICGLDWLTARMAAGKTRFVINMSLGTTLGITPAPQTCAGLARMGPESDPMLAAVCRAQAAGAIVVVAAGNDGWPVDMDAPSRYRDVITVSALSDTDGQAGAEGATCHGRDDHMADYSNFGAGVDVLAPGSCIRSTALEGVGKTVSMSGTSMAAPHVAGAVARLLERDPTISRAAITSRLVSTGSADWDETSDLDDAKEPLLSVERLMHLDGGSAFHAYPREEIVTIGRSREATTHIDIDRGTARGSLSAASAGNDVKLRLAMSGAGPGSDSIPVRLTLADTADRTGYARVRVSDGDSDEVVLIPYRLDTQAPFMRWDSPKRGFHLRGGADAIDTCASIRDRSDVRAVLTQRRIGQAAWETVARDDGLEDYSCSITRLRSGTAYEYRVLATDVAGNTGKTSVQQVAIDRHPIADLRLSGSWDIKPSEVGLIGRAGSKANGTFRARSLAVFVGTPTTDTRLVIKIDGTSLDYGGGSILVRRGQAPRNVFTIAWDKLGDHTISVRVVAGRIPVRSVLSMD